jgi:hypothetical protein
VRTGGYGGKKIRENVRIQTNDKTRPGLSVTVTGFVEKFADISPKRIMLSGTEGNPIKGRVTIIPKVKYPFKILSARARQGKYIKFHLTEDKRSNAMGYVLTVENLKKENGRYADAIFLKTNNKLRPEIPINVLGNILSVPPNKTD